MAGIIAHPKPLETSLWVSSACGRIAMRTARGPVDRQPRRMEFPLYERGKTNVARSAYNLYNGINNRSVAKNREKLFDVSRCS